MMNIYVRNRIKEICNEKNMTLRELSRLTGISHQQFSRDVINLRLENVAKVMIALDKSFDDIFEIVNFDDVK